MYVISNKAVQNLQTGDSSVFCITKKKDDQLRAVGFNVKVAIHIVFCQYCEKY